MRCGWWSWQRQLEFGIEHAWRLAKRGVIGDGDDDVLVIERVVEVMERV